MGWGWPPAEPVNLICTNRPNTVKLTWSLFAKNIFWQIPCTYEHLHSGQTLFTNSYDNLQTAFLMFLRKLYGYHQPMSWVSNTWHLTFDMSIRHDKAWLTGYDWHILWLSFWKKWLNLLHQVVYQMLAHLKKYFAEEGYVKRQRHFINKSSTLDRNILGSLPIHSSQIEN